VYDLAKTYTSGATMRTNIDIDDELMAATMKATGQKTKKGAVEEAMRRAVRNQAMRDLIERTRSIGWSGDLDAMREGRAFAEDDTPFDGKQ
jgi:Arc/MetJ family transcription regulator